VCLERWLFKSMTVPVNADAHYTAVKHADVPTEMTNFAVGSGRMERYDRAAIALHWVIAFGITGADRFGFLLDNIAPRNRPARGGVIDLYKSFGIVLGVAILAWRLANAQPAWPPSMPGWQQCAALLSHGALYACMVVMPLSGYVAPNFSKHEVRFFGSAQPPWRPDLRGGHGFLNGAHVAISRLFCARIVAALRPQPRLHRLVIVFEDDYYLNK
jgi:cytochrome b561